MKIGGVETFLTKMIPRWKNNKNNITLILLKNEYDEELLSLIKDYCEVIFLKKISSFKNLKCALQKADVAYCTINQALLWASFLLRLFNRKKCKIILGAHQTEIFCQKYNIFQLHRKILQNFISKKIPKENFIFVNSAVMKTHASRLGIDLNESPIIPLFVDLSRYKYKDRSLLPKKIIVSIGRISPYKTYNFSFLDVMKKLLEEGYDLEWRIYGDGENFSKLESAISKLGLKNHVKLFGNLDYSRFEDVLEEAFVYLGSGTTLIEAAACGVPSLSTIEYSLEPLSYGFIGDIQGYNLIEPGLSIPTYNIYDKVNELLLTDELKYRGISQSCYRKSSEYSSEKIPSEYLNRFNNAKFLEYSDNIGLIQLITYYVTGFFSSYLKKLENHL